MNEDIDELKKKLAMYQDKYGEIYEKRGLHNWKNLFRKPTFNDWSIFFMLVMALFIAWAYQHDIQVCKDYVDRFQNDWMNLTNGTGELRLSSGTGQTNYLPFNFTIQSDEVESVDAE